MYFRGVFSGGLYFKILIFEYFISVVYSFWRWVLDSSIVGISGGFGEIDGWVLF